MPKTHPNDDDEVPLGLPPMQGGGDEDLGPSAGALELEAEGEERVDLDDALGLDEDVDASELIGDLDSERPSLLGEESAIPDSLFTLLDDEPGPEEYGWTAGSECLPEEAFPDALVPPSLAPLAGIEDDGAEGVLDALAALDRVLLPPLDGERQEIPEDDSLFFVGDLSLPEARFPSVRMRGTLPGILSPSRFEVEHLGPDAQPIYLLAGDPQERWVYGETLSRIRAGRASPCEGRGLESEELTSIARIEGGLLVGTGWGGLLSASEVADRFEPRPFPGQGASRAPSTTVLVGPEPGRVWVRSGDGRLYQSRDGGRRFDPAESPEGILGLDIDRARGRLWAVQISPSGARRLASWDPRDGWCSRPLPSIDLSWGDGLLLAAHAGSLLVGRLGDPRGIWLSTDEGRSFEALPSLIDARAVALVEGAGAPIVYAALAHGRSTERGVLLRREGEVESLLLDVHQERLERGLGSPFADEALDRIHALDARASSPEETILDVATGVGLFRLRIVERG